MSSPSDEIYNEDETQAPDWLNAAFFTEVLRKHENDDNIKLHNLKITPGTAQGDHFASVMFRIGLEYSLKGKNKTISLIIKTMPEYEGLKKDMLHESYIFETEIGMYTEIIPKIEKILRSVGDDTVVGPPCVYHSLKPKKLIIFEDIVPHGYIVLRDRSPNLEEVRAALSKLAKLHAVSYKIKKESPEVFKEYSHNFMEMSNFMKMDFMKDGAPNFLKLLDNCPDLHQFKPYFENYQKDFLLRCQASFMEYRNNPQNDTYYVLCHGDFHTKNMMFKHNKETNAFEDVLLLDFQMSYIGPMCNDLMYAMYMLMDTELREKHKDELLYYYFSIFSQTLEKIKFSGPMPKYHQFRELLFRHRHFELFLIITFLPLMHAFFENKIDPAVLLEDPNVRKSFYENERYIEELRRLLPHLLHLGYFES